MPNRIENDYPQASLKNALAIAHAVSDLGESSSSRMVATRLNKKGGGAFGNKVSAAVKFMLVSRHEQKLHLTELGRKICLSYDEEEKRKLCREAFLNIPLFNTLCEKYSGKKLPVEHFGNVLALDYHIKKRIAPKIAGYFLKGGKDVGLVDGDDKIIPLLEAEDGESSEISEPRASQRAESPEGVPQQQPAQSPPENRTNSYRVRIWGPGVKLEEVEIQGEEDFSIVEAILRKVKVTLKSAKTKRGEPDEKEE